MLIAGTLALGGVGVDARLYRWVDENGVVQYTDTIPPSQVDKGRTELSKDGVRLETVPPARGLEELRRDQELERLRAQREQLVEQQKTADQVLLRTFRSADDLLMARDGKLAAIDVMIQVTRSNIRRHQSRLQNARTQAANLERAGKPVTADILDTIAKTEEYIQSAFQTIVAREQQKDAIRADFDRDLRRFQQLTNQPVPSLDRFENTRPPVVHNLVTCGNASECDRYWSRAVAYVGKHTTTPIQSVGRVLVITAPPQTLDDLSLTLARIEATGDGTASVFLDLQCKNTLPGDTDCHDERSLSVIEGFRAAVTSEPPTPSPGAAGPLR